MSDVEGRRQIVYRVENKFRRARVDKCRLDSVTSAVPCREDRLIGRYLIQVNVSDVRARCIREDEVVTSVDFLKSPLGSSVPVCIFSPLGSSSYSLIAFRVHF